MQDRITVGFFDSGIGGISVMTRARMKLPSADYIYYADTEHVPYGLKTREQIIEYADDAIECLISHGAQAVVVACNTATSMAIDHLRAKYNLPIIGIEPAVKPAAKLHSDEKILVCATPVTIGGEKLHSLIENMGIHPTLAATPGLVTLAENAEFDTDKVCRYLETVIDRKANYSAVVLGCTHFSYFRDSFRVFFGNDIDIIDGTEGVVNRLINVLGVSAEHDTGALRGTVTYIRSGSPVKDKKDIAFFEMLADRIRNEYK